MPPKKKAAEKGGKGAKGEKEDGPSEEQSAALQAAYVRASLEAQVRGCMSGVS